MFFLLNKLDLSNTLLSEWHCENCKQEYCLFSNFGKSHIDMLQNRITEQKYQKGERFFKQGQTINHIYILKEGVVKLEVNGELPGTESMLKLLVGGDIIGLHSIFNSPFTLYSAVAVENASACVIDFETFENFMMKKPELLRYLMEKFSAEIMKLHQRILSLQQKQIPGLLAETLLYLSREVYNQNPFDLGLTRKDFASLIGVSRENLIRTLSLFKKDNLIELDGNHIQLLDINSLEAISKNG